MRRNLASTAVRSDMLRSGASKGAAWPTLTKRGNAVIPRRTCRASRKRPGKLSAGAGKAPRRSIAIVVRFEGTALGDADVEGLLGSQAGKLGADLAQVQPGDLFIEVLGERVDLLFVLAPVGEELDLRQRLVGERGGHDEAWVTHGV